MWNWRGGEQTSTLGSLVYPADGGIQTRFYLEAGEVSATGAGPRLTATFVALHISEHDAESKSMSYRSAFQRMVTAPRRLNFIRTTCRTGGFVSFISVAYIRFRVYIRARSLGISGPQWRSASNRSGSCLLVLHIPTSRTALPNTRQSIHHGGHRRI
jgi:hypothetical protein